MNERLLEEFCLAHAAKYPALGMQDLVKALYQGEFGCGHLISDPERAKLWLQKESAECGEDGMVPLTEPLFGGFSRVYLQALAPNGLRVETLFRLFVLSAKETGDMAHFQQLLDDAMHLIEDGRLPIDPGEARAFLAQYRAAGCPATRHTEAFRQAYTPAYRVVRSDYCRYLPVMCRIDQLLAAGKPVVMAIEGGSASGKSTLAALLAEVYGAAVFHMDDFFLRPEQRTPERFAEPGGNVDRERFRAEVLDKLPTGEAVTYRPFDCSVMSLGAPVTVQPAALTVIEGAYCMHPGLRGIYNLSVFLTIDPQEQRERIARRNGPVMLARFENEWIPMEQRYFAHFDIPAACTLQLK